MASFVTMFALTRLCLVLICLGGACLPTTARREQTRFTGEMRYKGSRDYVDTRGGRGSSGSGTAAMKGVNGNQGGNAGGMGMGGVGVEQGVRVGAGFSVPAVPQQEGERDAPELVPPPRHPLSSSTPEAPPPAKGKSKGSGGGAGGKTKASSKQAKSSNAKAAAAAALSQAQPPGATPVAQGQAQQAEEQVAGVHERPVCPGSCPVPPERQLRYALQQYWANNPQLSFNCACAVVGHALGSHNMAHAIMYALTQAKDNSVNKGNDANIAGIINSEGLTGRSEGHSATAAVKVRKPAQAAPVVIATWEVLGPLPVGKLEVDADPAFDEHMRSNGDAAYQYEAAEWSGVAGRWAQEKTALDPIRHILTLPQNVSVYSELMSRATVQWRTYYASSQPPIGSIELRFGAAWNELVQGVSSSAALEFQGWARATTYARSAGSYGVFCQGVHTAYVINDGHTRLLVGDVYGAGKMVTTVDLRVGPVAIVLPLRGSVGLQFLCQLSEEPVRAADSLLLFPPRDVPHLVQLDAVSPVTAPITGDVSAIDAKNRGLLLSSIFTMPVHNTQAYPLSLAFSLETPQRGVAGTFAIRRARALHRSSTTDRRQYRGSSFAWNASHVEELEPALSTEKATIIGPGQVLLVPLEIIEEVASENGSVEHPHTYLNCRKGFPFTVVVTPSRGLPQRTQLEFQCRNRNESFLVSYIDHDGSVAQAAVLLPLPVTSHRAPAVNKVATAANKAASKAPQGPGPRGRRRAKAKISIPGGNMQADAPFVPSTVEELEAHEKLLTEKAKAATAAEAEPVSQAQNSAGTGADGATAGNNTSKDAPGPSITPNSTDATATAAVSSHPVLLSLHGTGTAAIAQADSYKLVPGREVNSQGDSSKSRRHTATPASAGGDGGGPSAGASERFVFGVEGFWVIAPTRWGAHNWEGVGELSAKHSIGAVQRVMERYPALLPQVWPHDGIVAGHSMGAHGAWLLATNDPDSSVCLSATAGWLAKEQYASSNAFFHLDVQNSYTQPALRAILARALQEYHVDELAGNLNGVERVHIRVGSGDQTTHPWFSRRMARLLVSKHRHNGTRLEEVADKQHWWWDTVRTNDGGVMNDHTMRQMYRECLLRSRNRQRRRDVLRMWQEEQPASKYRPSAPAAEECAQENTTEKTGAETKAEAGERLGHMGISSNGTRRNQKEFSRPSAHAHEGRKDGSNTEAAAAAADPQEALYDQLVDSNACNTGNFAVHAVNLAHSRGVCGVRILQQQQQLTRSSVWVTCSPLAETTQSVEGSAGEGDGNVPAELRDRLQEEKGSAAKGSNKQSSAEEEERQEQEGIMSPPPPAKPSAGRRAGSPKQQQEPPPSARLPSLERLKSQRCDIRTTNVLRLSIGFGAVSGEGADSTFYANNRLAQWYVNGFPLSLPHKAAMKHATVDLCWPGAGSEAGARKAGSASTRRRATRKSNRAAVCEHAIDPAVEKSPALQGPLRMAASRPLLVIYGTPRESALRLAMRDLAVYLANSHAAAHGTYVRVITDLEYRASGYCDTHGPASHNMILVGGPAHNKVMRAIVSRNPGPKPFPPAHGDSDRGGGGDSAGARDSVQGAEAGVPFEAVVPVEFKGWGLGGSASAGAGTARSSSSAAPQSERKEQGRQEEGDEHEEEQEEEEVPPADWFRIGPHVFDADKHTALFAFPITSHPLSRKSSSSGVNGANAAASALAVCITANSAAGYLHASRLAWPTVPPMVRAPFANYLPDFVVVDESVWAEGFGGVALAGYWDTWWRFDPTQAFAK